MRTETLREPRAGRAEGGELCRLFRSRVALAEDLRLLQVECERALARRSGSSVGCLT